MGKEPGGVGVGRALERARLEWTEVDRVDVVDPAGRPLRPLESSLSTLLMRSRSARLIAPPPGSLASLLISLALKLIEFIAKGSDTDP